MVKANKSYATLLIWIVTIIAIGSIIGSLTKPEISAWYNALHRAPLTPPNYIFPVAWTILYAIIGICGWIIWRTQLFPQLIVIKCLYVIQLILNWSWTPLFFHCHLVGLSFLILASMDILVSMLVWLTYRKIRLVSLLLIPYLFWILFASYLNFYIGWYN